MWKAFLAASTFVAVTAADACTTVADLDPGRPIIAYNYDFPIGQGLVLINKRGLAKSSAVQGRSAFDVKPATWQARFASITFVQFGRDNPMTGMNEAGLVVSQMWLDGARYEEPDERPVVGVLEWMQHVLDTSSTVEEALRLSAGVRIQSRVPLHYAVVDATGQAAFVEFLEGQRIVHAGDALPHAVLANSPYADSLLYLAQLQGRAAPDGTASLSRFARAAARTASAGAADPVGRAFATLASVAQPSATRWSIVYDPKNLTVQWRSDANGDVRSADLRLFDPSCREATRVFGIHEGSGDVSARFRAYTTVENEALVAASYEQTPFLAGLGADAARTAAHSPDRSVCTE